MFKVGKCVAIALRFLVAELALLSCANAKLLANIFSEPTLELQKSLSKVFDERCNSLVKVTSLKKADNSAEYYETASGFFVSQDGAVLTTALVTYGASKIWVENQGVIYEAKSLGFDPFTGVSVIKIYGDKRPESPSFIELTPVKDLPKIATMLFSISCELGFSPSPRLGILSGHNINLGNTILPSVYIRSNIPSFRGSIGGAVFDVNGEFVGMTIASLPANHGSFIIPRNVLVKIYGDIINHSRVVYSWFGLNTKNADCGGRSFVKITHIFENAPADTAGLKVGDVIKKVDSVEINSNLQLRSLVFFMKPGQSVNFEVFREGKTLQTTLKLVEMSPSQMQGALRKFDELQRRNRNICNKSKGSDIESQTLENMMPEAN